MPSLSFPKSDIRILITESIHKSSLENFKEHGYTNIDYLTGALNQDELIKIIDQYHFIGVRSRTHLTAEVLSHAKKLAGIGCFSVGTNQIDLEAAKKKGIPVFNAPYSSTRSVAELVVGQAIMLMRGIPEKNAGAHTGQWLKSAKDSYEVRGKTLGIVGYGHIGSQAGILAEGMGMHVIYHDTVDKLPFGNARPVKTLKDLLKASDIVSLHVPQTTETKCMIGFDEIKEMKKGSHLINASRGNVVVIEALAAALREKHIHGAAIDVFPKEPKQKDEAFVSELQEFPNVILTPHIGGSTMEGQVNIGKEVSGKLISLSDTGTTHTAVNFPEVNLPQVVDKHRFLHIHENKHGALTQINDIFSDLGINISAQYLQTDPYLGYVITDTDPHPKSGQVLKQLKAVDGTIRARTLY